MYAITKTGRMTVPSGRDGVLLVRRAAMLYGETVLEWLMTEFELLKLREEMHFPLDANASKLFGAPLILMKGDSHGKVSTD